MSKKLKIDDQLIRSLAMQKLSGSAALIFLKLKLEGLDNCQNLPKNWEIQYMFKGEYSVTTIIRSISQLKEKGLIT